MIWRSFVSPPTSTWWEISTERPRRTGKSVNFFTLTYKRGVQWAWINRLDVAKRAITQEEGLGAAEGFFFSLSGFSVNSNRLETHRSSSAEQKRCLVSPGDRTRLPSGTGETFLHNSALWPFNCSRVFFSSCDGWLIQVQILCILKVQHLPPLPPLRAPSLPHQTQTSVDSNNEILSAYLLWLFGTYGIEGVAGIQSQFMLLSYSTSGVPRLFQLLIRCLSQNELPTIKIQNTYFNYNLLLHIPSFSRFG